MQSVIGIGHLSLLGFRLVEQGRRSPDSSIFAFQIEYEFIRFVCFGAMLICCAEEQFKVQYATCASRHAGTSSCDEG
jgi:hypothetical protein